MRVNVCIDKISPIINVISDGKKETFSKSNTTEAIKKSNDITIEVSDNTKIKHNKYYYNPVNFDFSNLESTEFESGRTFTEEGFYKFISIDSFENKTEIVVLVDKTPPNIFIEYFKKEETAFLNLKKVAAIYKTRNVENIENISDENYEENIEISENIISNNVIEENEAITNTANVIENIANQEITTQNIVEETQSQNEDIVDKQENIIEQSEVIEVDVMEENQIMLTSASDMYVGNETEFKNALANKTEVIHVRESIDFTSPIYINYSVKIIGEGISNSLRYGKSGNFIVVQNGGTLTVDGMVIDTNSSGVNAITTINIQSGGIVTFVNSSIIDGGSENTGILVSGGATLVLWSSEIIHCNLGINLQSNGKLLFATQDGRYNNFYFNSIAVYIDNFSGNCNFNQNILIHNNTNGIHTVKISGKVEVSSGEYYNNHNGINCGGNIVVSGGSFYDNVNGIFTTGIYEGNLTITNCSINSNTNYAIYHDKENNGGCTILGGNIDGLIYLGQNNNYINTNSNYPKFTVIPSTYYFKRKLVKTTSNTIAQKEIENVTLTPKNSWYKYVDNEYIVIWEGCNVLVQYKDYYGKLLDSETIKGNLGEKYSTTSKEIDGYDLINIPTNAEGVFSEKDIIVEYKYDLVNCAKVNFEDLLSGISSSKYWYNEKEEKFEGEGTDFDNNIIFEKYGYYKILVENNVGLKKEIIFVLDKNSFKR